MHHVEESDQKMAAHPEIYIRGDNSVFSIHMDSQTVGVCALKQDEEGEFELTKMAVHDAYQNRGLGQVLMDTVESYARDTLKRKRIYLLSNTINAAAIRLYKRCGWIPMFEGSHPQYYARCNIGMEKML